MKTKEEFASFYERELSLEIEKLEELRLDILKRFSFKKYGHHMLMLLVLAILILLIEKYLYSSSLFLNGALGFLIFTIYGFFGPIYILIRRGISFDKINDEYLSKSVPKILKFIDANLEHKPEDGISSREFKLNTYFSDYASFSSNNLIEGNIGDINYRLANLKVLSAKSQNSKSRSTIFSGTYVIAESEHYFKGKIIVKPSLNNADLLTRLAISFQRNNNVNTLEDTLYSIKTGNADFDHFFDVEGTDQEAAMRVLKSSIQTLLLYFKFETSIDKSVHLFIFENQIHIALSDINIFDIDFHISLRESKSTDYFFNIINNTIGISNALKLNYE